MAKKNRRLKTKEEEEFNPLDELFSALSRRLDKVPVGKGKQTAIVWGVVAVLLIAASSVMFHFNWLGTWVPALIGAPAGLILYLIGSGLIRRTKIGEWEIFHMRKNYSFRQRMRRIVGWFVVYALVFIPLGRFIPYGVGGAILIVLFMSALETGRRTPQELAWAKEGIPDPRDLEEVDEKDEYADDADNSPVQPEEPQADTLYYDEQRGGFGGKLK